MRTDVFQAAAVCCRGNAFLAGEDRDRAPELVGATDLFRNVNEVSFTRTSGLAINNGCLAVGTKSWFLKMRKEGVEHFRLAFDLCQRGSLPKEVCGWGIVSDGDCGTELWQPAWKGLLVRYNEPSAYRVGYVSAKHSPWAIRQPESLDVSLNRLRGLLKETLQASIEYNLADLFDEIRTAWSGKGPGLRITEEILGDCHDQNRRDLILSAVQSILLIEGNDWKVATERHAQSEALGQLSDRLWSASLRAFESSATYRPALSV